MSRRLHACLSCEPGDTPFTRKRGFTRHSDRVCSWCRRRGVTHRDGVLRVPLEIYYSGRAGG